MTATWASALAESYHRYAHCPALHEAGGSLTFAELGVRARRLASGLAALGVRPADRVMIVATNRPEYVLLDHALAMGGFVRVAVSHRLHPAEIKHIAQDCEPKVIVVDGERAEGVSSAVADIERPAVVVSFDDDSPGGVGARFADLLAHPEIEPVPAQPEQVAWLPYTSGTTGQPKGVMLSHRSLMACFRNLQVELPPVETSDVVLHVAPLTHLSGYLGHAYAIRGASQLVLPEFSPSAVLGAIVQHGVTVLPLAPTMLNLMLPELESQQWRLDSLHTVLYAGSAISPDRLARAVACLGEVFVQAYGLTEIPFPLVAMSKAEHRFDPGGRPPTRLASAGRPNPYVELRLRRADGTDAADGEEGEIQVRSDTTMLGYWNRPEDTAEMLLEDGWAATGDIGRVEDGYVHIVDRKKDMIVSGGFNVFPGEVENAISALEGISEVAVIGVPHERWGEAIHAVAAVRDGHTLTEQDIKRVCRERIAAYKTPRSVDFVSELPKTGTGKIQRHELRRRHWEGRDRRIGG